MAKTKIRAVVMKRKRKELLVKALRAMSTQNDQLKRHQLLNVSMALLDNVIKKKDASEQILKCS